jgi:hypothetical protein
MGSANSSALISALFCYFAHDARGRVSRGTHSRESCCSRMAGKPQRAASAARRPRRPRGGPATDHPRTRHRPGHGRPRVRTTARPRVCGRHRPAPCTPGGSCGWGEPTSKRCVRRTTRPGLRCALSELRARWLFAHVRWTAGVGCQSRLRRVLPGTPISAVRSVQGRTAG